VSPFEFVFALISIITSLALTQIIAGVVAIIRHRQRGSFSLTHALWVWIAFAVVVGNWGALWSTQGDPAWPAIRVFAWLVSMTSLYAFCALVIPEIDRDRQLDLNDFHEREGRRYIIAHNVFALLASIMAVLVSGISAESRNFLLPSTIAFVLGSVALLTRGRAQLAATIPLVFLALIYMLVNIDKIAG
jgi:hypothetical protein